jgi:hypothetical protein
MSNVDIMLELKLVLTEIFGPCLRDFHIEQFGGVQSVPSMGGPIMTQMSQPTTRLHLRLALSESYMMRMNPQGSLENWLDLGPNAFCTNRSQSFSSKTMLLHEIEVSYALVGTIEEFIDFNKNKAWKRFNALIDEQLSEVLDVDDR